MGECMQPPLYSSIPQDILLENRYKIVDALGEGATGTVVLAHDQQFNNQAIALKFLHRHLLFSAASLGRFRSEIRVTMSLNHPHILQTYGLGLHHNEYFYLKMEYLDGVTLAEDILQSRLNFEQKVVVLRDIASALMYAHQRGIIHRDLKPENVLLDSEKRPKVADFGLAQMIQLEARYTGHGDVLGTPYYMSPEQLRSEPLDSRCDIYSFGILAYEVLTGEKPFEAESFLELAEQHLHSPLPFLKPLAHSTPDSTQWLADLLNCCTQKERHLRLASMDEVFDILDEHCEVEALHKKSSLSLANQSAKLQSSSKPKVRYQMQKLFSRYTVSLYGLIAFLLVLLAPWINPSMQWRYAAVLLYFEHSIGLPLDPLRLVFNVDPSIQYPDSFFEISSYNHREARNRIRPLLRLGRELDVYSEEVGTYAFHHSLELQDNRTIEEFFYYGANPNLIDSQGLTALGHAVRIEDFNPFLISLLLEGGADPDLTSPGTIPPLAYSLAHKEVLIAEMLLTRGSARADIASNLDLPILHLAVLCGQARIVELVIERGASATEVDDQGRTALEFAKSLEGIPELERILHILEKVGKTRGAPRE